ncbi:MAG: hypothetical protein ABEJ85_06095 [Haloarculaceae archaeon]
MNPENVPLLETILTTGPENHLFDALLLAGPLVIAVVVLFGRTALTLAMAVGYLLAFVGGIAYTVSHRRHTDGPGGNART